MEEYRDRIQAVLDLYLENPFWKEYYEKAPSDTCREYIKLEFYNSQYEEKELINSKYEVEERLTLTDWKHLLHYCGNNRRREVIKRKMEDKRPIWTIPAEMETTSWKRLYDGDTLAYEGYATEGNVPCGVGVRFFPNGQRYQEGIWGGKGLLTGREYYPDGQLRFEGVYRYNSAYGPNYPVYGRCFLEDGTKYFEGELKIRQGGVGWPFVIEPEEYGMVLQECAPKVREWSALKEVKSNS